MSAHMARASAIVIPARMPARPASADTARRRRRPTVVFGPALSVKTIALSSQCPGADGAMCHGPEEGRSMELAGGEFGLGAATFAGENADGGLVRLEASRNGNRSCTSVAPRSPRLAARHTAPIGNLGMRTQATRHSNCTVDLHDSMRTPASFLHQNPHPS